MIKKYKKKRKRDQARNTFTRTPSLTKLNIMTRKKKKRKESSQSKRDDDDDSTKNSHVKPSDVSVERLFLPL